MSPRKAPDSSVKPTLPSGEAYKALKQQLEILQQLKGRRCDEAEYDEKEWVQVTRSIFEDAFGDPSSTLSSFNRAESAGEYYIGGGSRGLDQRNFETRLQSMETCVKATLKQLELRMPKPEIKGAYAPGEEYEVYKDIQTILSKAKGAILIVDPYLNKEIFELYVHGIDRSVQIRILTDNLPNDALTIATKYAAGGNLHLRSTKAIHDRVIFVDAGVWMVGQSIKDAAKQKPTYIIEHDASLMLPLYEDIWSKATTLI